MKNILAIQSHVVYGHAGNSAGVFPIRRLGVNVWPLNTVQFSNHTQYRKWKGAVMSGAHLMEVVDGISDIDQLKRCDAVLSGYLGSPGQGEAVINVVKKVKSANPNAIYFCDPVIGQTDKGCFVEPGVADFFSKRALFCADMIAPNLLELEQLSNKTVISSVEDAVQASRDLCEKGPKVVLVKHLSYAGYHQDHFEMLLVTPHRAWHISRPLVDFGHRQPVGVGNLTSGLFLANYLLGRTLLQSLEHTTATVYGVIMETLRRGEYELQLVAAQDEIVRPSHHFCAQRID